MLLQRNKLRWSKKWLESLLKQKRFVLTCNKTTQTHARARKCTRTRTHLAFALGG